MQLPSSKLTAPELFFQTSLIAKDLVSHAEGKESNSTEVTGNSPEFKSRKGQFV